MVHPAEPLDKGNTLFALFAASTPLKPVIEQLRQQELPDDAMEVISPLPLPTDVAQPSITVPLYLITIIAGVVGIGVGIFFAGGTAAMYPLMTGGKPIVARPIVGIISFETMMLLGIVVTFIAMVIGIKRTHRSPVGHDPRIDEGAVGIVVYLDPNDARRESVRTLLREAGATEVRTQ